MRENPRTGGQAARAAPIIVRMAGSTLMTTDAVAPRDRAPAWREWIWKHFGGLESDLYGDSEFDGHIAASRAGDVILTKLEANRHRVLRTPEMARGSEAGYLKIVAPWQGSAQVEQRGRHASRHRCFLRCTFSATRSAFVARLDRSFAAMGVIPSRAAIDSKLKPNA